jgi:hypothetical protein
VISRRSLPKDIVVQAKVKHKPEFRIGDSVKARLRYGCKAGKLVSGVITNMDWGEGDTLAAVTLHIAGDKFVDVNPGSIRYITGRGGFASRFNDDGSLTIFRNDGNMLKPMWWRRFPKRGTENGAGLLYLYLTFNGHAAKKTR